VSIRLRRLRFGVADLALLAFAILLCLFQRSERLLQIGADTVVDRAHEFFFGHGMPSFEGSGVPASVRASRADVTLLFALTALVVGPVHRSSVREDDAARWSSSHLRVHSHIDANQGSAMTLAQVSQAISEIFKNGGLWQFARQCAGLEHGQDRALKFLASPILNINEGDGGLERPGRAQCASRSEAAPPSCSGHLL
jgi:hypothetical protein